MVTDIILGATSRGARRIMVDTKFTSITLTSVASAEPASKAAICIKCTQYVRSQEGRDPRSDTRLTGLFLHPAIETSLHEHAEIQGHTITFATVNLSASPATIRSEMRGILNSNCAAAKPLTYASASRHVIQ